MITKKYLILIALAGFIIALDQAAKIYVHANFQWSESIEVIPGYFNLTYVRNTGAAFGILSQSHETFRKIFFLTMPLIASLIIIFIIRGLGEKDTLQVFALSSIFGGAIGNYIDRVMHGFVVDYLDFHFQRIYVWPAFNVADIAIVIGVGILMLLMLLEWKNERNGKAAAPTPQ